MRRNVDTKDDEVTEALAELIEIADGKGMSNDFALIGGQALRFYGVPRGTLDMDILVTEDKIEDLVNEMVNGDPKWIPLEYDEEKNDYVEVDNYVAHRMDDPVLFDMGQERVMYPTTSKSGMIVEFLTAQHPIELDMIDGAMRRDFIGVKIPIAPLGGILAVKTKADRPKDVAAIEQAVEHLPGKTIEDAIRWAANRDRATAEDLRSMANAVWVRRKPVSKERRGSRGT